MPEFVYADTPGGLSVESRAYDAARDGRLIASLNQMRADRQEAYQRQQAALAAQERAQDFNWRAKDYDRQVRESALQRQLARDDNAFSRERALKREALDERRVNFDEARINSNTRAIENRMKEALEMADDGTFQPELFPDLPSVHIPSLVARSKMANDLLDQQIGKEQSLADTLNQVKRGTRLIDEVAVGEAARMNPINPDFSAQRNWWNERDFGNDLKRLRAEIMAGAPSEDSQRDNPGFAKSLATVLKGRAEADRVRDLKGLDELVNYDAVQDSYSPVTRRNRPVTVGAATTQPMVRVRLPNGQTGTVPAANVSRLPSGTVIIGK